MSVPLLGVYGMTYQYGHRRVLDEVSFEVEKGKIVAVLGPNGSGKSTLLKAIAGILSVMPAGKSGKEGCNGLVRHAGEDLFSLSPLLRARVVAYVGAEMRADFPVTAYEAVSLGRICQSGTGLAALTSSDQDAVRQAMEEALCWKLRDRELATLSGGERQLVGLARAFAQGSRILILDEALSKMDLNHVAIVGSVLKKKASEQGMSVLLVSHDIHVAMELADSCVLLKSGKRIAFGPMSQVITTERLAELYPGARLRVETSAGGASTVSLGLGK